MSSYYEKFLATGEVKCIDEEIPFEVPKGWEWCRLRDIIKGTNAGKSPNCEKRPKREDEWGVLTTTAIQENVFLPTENKVLPPNYIVNPEHSVKHGDILITRAGPVNRTGVVCLVDKECNNLILSDKTVRIDYLRNYCNPIFIVFVLNSPTIHELLMSVTVGMASSQVNVSQDNIQNTLIPFPCIKMQNRIVEKITNLLPIIERYKSEQEQLEELNAQLSSSLKKSILQEAIQGRLVPQITEEGSAKELLEQIQQEKQRLVKEGKLKKSALYDSIIYKGDDNKYFEKKGKDIVCIDEEIPFEIPESWEWCRISTICNITNGFTPLRTEDKFWRNGNINWFTVEDIRTQGEYINYTTQKITKEATTPERIVRPGSILLCCTASVGQCAFTNIPTTTNQQFNALTIKDYYRPLMIDEYLFLFAKTLKDELHRLSGKTTFEFISVKKVGNILVPIPPLNEQKRIVAIVNKSLASIMSR